MCVSNKLSSNLLIKTYMYVDLCSGVHINSSQLLVFSATTLKNIEVLTEPKIADMSLKIQMIYFQNWISGLL